ncbi:MAG: hypothetical protein AB1656_16865 [Candidatus Omnitrophota bacterium]
MFESPISPDFRDLALNAVEKSNDAEAVNKALDDLAKYFNAADENSQAQAAANKTDRFNPASVTDEFSWAKRLRMNQGI